MTSLGIVLLVLGAVVAVAEAHYPTHGVAGSAGVVVMAIGAVLAISGVGAGLLVAMLAGILLAAAGGGVLVLTVGRGLDARQRRIVTGAQGMLGHIGVVRSWEDGTGSILLDGAVWRARRSPCLEEGEAMEVHVGDHVVVERLDGLTVTVRPAEEWELI